MTAQKRERDLHSLTPHGVVPELPFWGEGPRERTMVVQAALCDPSAWVRSLACARDDGLWAEFPARGDPSETVVTGHA